GPKYGNPETKAVGDIGYIKADADGLASGTLENKYVMLEGPYSVIRRSVVLYNNSDGKEDGKYDYLAWRGDWCSSGAICKQVKVSIDSRAATHPIIFLGVAIISAILGAAVKELRRDGSKKLQSGLTCEEAAAEIVKDISDGPWDADLTEAIINSGGFLSSASVYQHENIDLAVKVAENTALTTRVSWAFVGELVERYRSGDKTADLLSFVTKSKAVVIRQLRALRSSAALPVLETFVSLEDSVLVNTCADAAVRMSRALHTAATKRTVHWYTTSQTRYGQFQKWLQSGLASWWTARPRFPTRSGVLWQ
ncbi:hypothetical protein FOZ62_007688, partial [Perkinsus olseni]